MVLIWKLLIDSLHRKCCGLSTLFKGRTEDFNYKARRGSLPAISLSPKWIKICSGAEQIRTMSEPQTQGSTSRNPLDAQRGSRFPWELYSENLNASYEGHRTLQFPSLPALEKR